MEDSLNMPQPDKLRFVGPVKDPQKVESARAYLETNKVAMPPEQKKSPEREKQVEGMIEALSEFARDELGIDLSKRIPSDDRFHFFDNDGYQKVRELHGLQPGSVGVHSTSGHMLAKEEPVVEETLGNSQHELIHITSYRTINLCEIESGLWTKRGHSGYANETNQALSMIDEALTEMTNLEVMANHWQNQQALSQMDAGNYGNIGYIEQVVVVDELVKRIADKNGREYKDVLRELQRGKFLGEMQALRILTGEVGKDGMKMLAKWILDPNESIEIVQSLGLTEAQTKIQALRQGQDVQVMERIAPDIVHRQSARPKVLS